MPTPGQKAAATRKLRQAGAKAALTRRRRNAGRKAAATLKRRNMSKENSLDMYSQDRLIGNIELRDGKLHLSGPDVEALASYMDLVREVRDCKTDTEVFSMLGDVFNSQAVHLRTYGNSVGATTATAVKLR